jgi:hypothetical protein
MENRAEKVDEVDAASILSSIWARNALRREAHLPLLPVKETFEHEREQALWRVHLSRNYDQTRTATMAECRARYGKGWGLSASGRWAVHLLAMQALRASFSPR